MPWLPWIEDHALEQEVRHLLQIAKVASSKTAKGFNANVIDPFAALFEMSGFNLDYSSWIKNEKNRQAQKTLQNHIGDFHQNILGHVDGWVNLKTGSVIDLACEQKKKIAEIKNKYNTVSGGKLSDLYYSLDNLVSPKSSIYKGFTAYYVAIIPKNSRTYDRPFTPSDKGKGSKCPTDRNIREIDGKSFYAMVTGHSDALKDLFLILPKIVEAYNLSNIQLDQSNLLTLFNEAFS